MQALVLRTRCVGCFGSPTTPEWYSCMQVGCRSCQQPPRQTACSWTCMLPTRCHEWEGWVSCLVVFGGDTQWPCIFLAEAFGAGLACSFLRCAPAQSQAQRATGFRDLVVTFSDPFPRVRRRREGTRPAAHRSALTASGAVVLFVTCLCHAVLCCCCCPAGRRVRAVPHKLVVDVREFMSGLPAVLHSQGFKLTPITLEVQDGLQGVGVTGFRGW